MPRSRLVRVQIILLVLLALLVLARMILGPPTPKGLAVLAKLDAFDLDHIAFELQQPGAVTIEGVGSFDPAAVPSALAAYGWIVRRTDGAVVWEMTPRSATPGRGHLARTGTDTLRLEAGVYDAYFSSYGAVYGTSRSRAEWRKDADEWQLVVRLLDASTPARALPDYHLDMIGKNEADLVWRAAPLRDDAQESYLFEVKHPVELRIRAVGEIAGTPGDYARIENAATGEILWKMTRGNTVPAGGLPRNRRFEGTVRLEPGTYHAVAVTDERHAFRDWKGNPPYEPAAWGLALYADDPDAITAFDLWRDRTPLVSFTEVPDDAERSQRFEVLQPVDVILDGTGEITDDGSVYDFGELLKEDGGRLQRVWKMSLDGSTHAGGGSKNRREVLFTRLDPGIYTLRYETDGSHAYGDWNTSRPDYPERWGVSLFTMKREVGDETIRLLPGSSTWGTLAEAPPAPPPPGSVAHVGDALVDWNRLGPDFELRQDITFEEPVMLHIVSLGEISAGGQHDFGWIEEAETGVRVWEMTRDNTRPAGGAERNRRFDGLVALDPGRYVIRYRTDYSHHFGDFGNEAPRNPASWGLTAYRVRTEGTGVN